MNWKTVGLTGGLTEWKIFCYNSWMTDGLKNWVTENWLRNLLKSLWNSQYLRTNIELD